METVELGRTGLKIAPLGVGAMSWGRTSPLAYGGTGDPQAEVGAVEELLKAGVNLVDTAEMYRNERRVGELVRGRQEVVLATKYAPFPHRRRSSVLAALDRSLQRLGRDHVELYQVHMAPRTMSIPTLMRELAVAHRDGRVRAIGVSNFNAAQTRQAHAALAEEGIPLASNQMQYSLLYRRPEVNGVLDTCRELGVTLIAYMPLASGALTGSYQRGNRPGGIRRLMPYFRAGNLDAIGPLIGLLTEIGRAHDAPPATVALRWLVQRGTVPIPGAKNARQARANAAALRIELDGTELDALSKATERWRR
jgi:aryl-alcohol dehydrogenase-like predicted oxidoreductase